MDNNNPLQTQLTQLQQQLQQSQQSQQQGHQTLQQAQAAMQQMLQRIQQLERQADAAQAANQHQSSPGGSEQSSSSSSSNPSSVHIKPLPPQPFNGSLPNINPDQWLQEMERFLQVGGEKQTRWVAMSSTFLKGAASVWFNSLSDQEKMSDWSTFTDLFRQRFRPFEAARIARAAIDHLHQRGRVMIYIEQFQQKLELVPDLPTTWQVHFFVRG